MTPEELRKWSAEVLMGWVPPLPLPVGTYEAVYKDDKMKSGEVIGFRYQETKEFYDLDRWKKHNGWTDSKGQYVHYQLNDPNRDDYWHPDLDINQAFMCVESMQSRGFDFSLYDKIDGKPWCCIYTKGDATKFTPDYRAYADTPALAILQAAHAALTSS